LTEGGGNVKDENDIILKNVELCELYAKMTEQEREALVRVAVKLSEAQSSIGNDKAKLTMGTDRQGVV
jgi:hypothetical protein